MMVTRDDLDRLEREVARRANAIASSGRRSLLGHPDNLAPERAAAILLGALAAMEDGLAAKPIETLRREVRAA